MNKGQDFIDYPQRTAMSQEEWNGPIVDTGPKIADYRPERVNMVKIMSQLQEDISMLSEKIDKIYNVIVRNPSWKDITTKYIGKSNE